MSGTPTFFGRELHHQFCGCKRYCGDVREEDDHPLAVCKCLPASPRPPLVEVRLRLARDKEADRG